jgi:hypothetical protein
MTEGAGRGVSYGETVSQSALLQRPRPSHPHLGLTALGALLVSKGALILALALAVGAFPVRHLVRWDAGWYLGIIEDGYQYPNPDGKPQSNLAFFPLLPALSWALARLGIPAEASLLAVSWAGGIAATLLIARLGARVATPAVGAWLALLWCVAPRSHVLAMGYTEGLFTAFAAAFLLALLNRQWWRAGIWAALAGLTRSTVLALITTLGIAIVIEQVRKARGRPAAPVPTLLGSAVLSGSGFLAYWLFVAWHTGSFWGYLEIQEAWGSVTVLPLETVQAVVEVLVSPGGREQWEVGVALSLVAYLILLAWMVIRRERWELISFVVFGMLLVFMQSGHFESKARLLLPLFPLWLPLARLLARAPGWFNWPLAVIAVGGATLWGVNVATMDMYP